MSLASLASCIGLAIAAWHEPPNPQTSLCTRRTELIEDCAVTTKCCASMWQDKTQEGSPIQGKTSSVQAKRGRVGEGTSSGNAPLNGTSTRWCGRAGDNNTHRLSDMNEPAKTPSSVGHEFAMLHGPPRKPVTSNNILSFDLTSRVEAHAHSAI